MDDIANMGASMTCNVGKTMPWAARGWDFFNTTYKNGDDWGMVQMDANGIVLPTL